MVQTPKSLGNNTITTAMSQTGGPIKDYYGIVFLPTECGVYAYVVSDLLDQNGNKITNSRPFTLNEMFSNYSSTNTNLTKPATQNEPQNTRTQGPADIQFLGRAAPSCPGPNDNETFDQSFSVTINGKTLPLTTVRHISRGYFNGALKVSITTTTK